MIPLKSYFWPRLEETVNQMTVTPTPTVLKESTAIEFTSNSYDHFPTTCPAMLLLLWNIEAFERLIVTDCIVIPSERKNLKFEFAQDWEVQDTLQVQVCFWTELILKQIRNLSVK